MRPLVAGDLFEDNEIDDSIVRAAVSLFAAFADVPVFILPGNHDPFIGPGSVWNRQSFLDAPNHVKVFRAAECVEINGGYLLASPLQQKNSTLDPSLKLGELATKLSAERIQAGVTHGALAIPSKHEPNDFPIALNAASRAKLDYLAVGHWHNWLLSDDGRLLMPGTPETAVARRRDLQKGIETAEEKLGESLENFESLEARLSGTFSEISRDADRRVFLDEQLQISGIGASREAMISFAHLSQGAKEQLLLCLRLAVAGEVSSSGHKPVVLDDALANTDGQRQQRLLDLLQTSAEQLQILILTCHPERYRGVGTVTEIRYE